MHRPLSHAEVEALNKASPVKEMTRVEKLTRWAELLRKCGHAIYLGDRIEYLSPEARDATEWMCSPMSVAAADPVLTDAGLKNGTIGEAKRFFEITDEDVHAFSCNCGGHQTGANMASRIDAIAKGPGIVNKIGSAIFG